MARASHNPGHVGRNSSFIHRRGANHRDRTFSRQLWCRTFSRLKTTQDLRSAFPRSCFSFITTQNTHKSQ